MKFLPDSVANRHHRQRWLVVAACLAWGSTNGCKSQLEDLGTGDTLNSEGSGGQQGDGDASMPTTNEPDNGGAGGSATDNSANAGAGDPGEPDVPGSAIEAGTSTQAAADDAGVDTTPSTNDSGTTGPNAGGSSGAGGSTGPGGSTGAGGSGGTGGSLETGAGGDGAGGSGATGMGGDAGMALATELLLVSSDPADGATAVDPLTTLTLVFDDDISVATGSIQIVRQRDDQLFDEVAVDGAQVSVDGATLTVDLNGILGSSTDYYVTIDEGAIESGELTYSGVSEMDALVFRTVDETVAETAAELLVWLDADYDSSIQESGATVSGWLDRSGNNNSMSQATTSRQPSLISAAIEGLPALRFDGSNDVLLGAQLPDLAGFEIFAVWRTGVAVGASYAKLLARGTNFEFNHSHLTPAFRGSGACQVGTTWHAVQFEPIQVDTSYLWDLSRDGADHSMRAYTNGLLNNTNTDMSAAPTASTLPFAVGARSDSTQMFNGDIGEVLVFDAALDAGDRDAIEAYIENKWGIDTSP